jgi:predicted HNH restriction endonuclease
MHQPASKLNKHETINGDLVYEGTVDPETDLVPLCATCHAMAHRRRDTVTSIDELKALINKAKG